MIFYTREEVIAMTPLWKGERFEDGRPKVADRYLDALYSMTLEELWKPIFVQGYENNFVAIKPLHPEFKEDGTVNRKMIGRAVTAMYAPTRPDYAQAQFATAAANGLTGTPNQWVVDHLQPRDVMVIDMYDKIYKGTFLGGNLTTALRNKTGTGGAVIWGGIRDIEQMHKVPDVQVYYRGIDPTPIRDFAMTGYNTPVRIGDGREAAMQNNTNLIASEVISTYVYKTGMSQGTTQFSYASAIGLFNSLVNCAMLIIFNTLSNRLSRGNLGLF